MKRIWSLFAVLALLCALTIPALAAAGGAADPHVDDDGSCVYRDGHHLCADRGHPDHLRIVTITRKVE